MHIYRLSSFSIANAGGNPAGVALLEAFPDVAHMQSTAAEVGFSETAFAMPVGAGAPGLETPWRVRYFSPESEVPFCGHATVALGAQLALIHGPGTYQLVLNESEIFVSAAQSDDGLTAALQSPPTRSETIDELLLAEALALFGYDRGQVNMALPPARIHGGADHLMIALNSRDDLRAMIYDLDAGRAFMNAHGLVTVMFVFARGDQTFDVRNAFASGGVLEDPATGAAAAAFSGYLRDIGWPHGGRIKISQGEDMGSASQIFAEISDEVGASVRVSGAVRLMEAA